MKKELTKFIVTALVVLFIIPLHAFAYDQYESMNVGETKTFYFPSEVTNRASLMYSYNCSSDYVNHVEVVSYTNTSVTVKALAYTQSQVNIRFDYWWYENNYGRHDTHMVHIDLNGGGGSGNTGSDYNPYNYDIDYGNWGTITVEVGQTTTVYCQYETPNPSKVKSILWSDYQQLGNYDITYQSSSSCTIKGRFAYSGTKLWCLMKYGSNTFKAYYTVNVKESTKQTLSLSANPDGGKVDKGKIVHLTASNSSADIYYTLNGSTPTASSTKYTSSGIIINEDCTLKAVAKKSGYNDSPVMTWVYTVEDSSPVIAEINATNFPDENFRNYLLQQDYGQDGKLTSNEISSISEINVQQKQICNLKGIEFFIAITHLYCRGNQLESIDVSRNTALVLLDCEGNKLTSLDLKYNTALNSLWCNDNKIQSLDLSKNMSLGMVDCHMNYDLTSLIFPNTSRLNGIVCHLNSIQGTDMDALINSLPLNQSNNLHYLRIIMPGRLEHNICTKAQVATIKSKGWTPQYYNSGWQEYEGSEEIVGIDINATNFPDANFRNYLLSQNYGQDGMLTDKEIQGITYISVNGKNISSLKGIEFFTALTSLWCVNNQLTSLDVSKNTVLSRLYCYDNQLESLDISKNTSLTDLSCDHNQLTSLDVSKNTLLDGLSCHNNQLKSLDVSKNTALSDLFCDCNQLSSLDVSKNTALEFLYCYNNHLTTLDVSKNSLLHELSCHNNQITTLDVSKNRKLNSLSCEDNKLIALDVTKNVILQYLSCNNNNIKGKAMDSLINSLPQYTTSDRYTFCVVDPTSDTEGNVCTKDQVKAVKKKGWFPCYYDGKNRVYVEYEGSEVVKPINIVLPSTATVVAGETITLTPEITPENAEYTLTWTSDDKTIATVDANGVVTGVKRGRTFINVETDNGKTAYCKLTVTAPEPIKIELPKSATVTVGGTLTLTPIITPEDAETTLTWKSDDESVARVDANGVLTGVDEGLALVTVSTANGLTSNACKVSIIPTGISTVMMGEKAGVPVYSTSGQRLAAPRKGVNIVGGRKVVVK